MEFSEENKKSEELRGLLIFGLGVPYMICIKK